MNIQSGISRANKGKVRARKASERTSYPSGSSRLVVAVARAFDDAPRDLSLPTRGRRQVARARQSGIYLARMVFGMTLSDAGGLFHRDRTTAAHACRLVEDLRDDPHFDQLLMGLEDHLHMASIGCLQ